MRLLFDLGMTTHIRHFDSIVPELERRGHTVILNGAVNDGLGQHRFEIGEARDHRDVLSRVIVNRADAAGSRAYQLRCARDYIQYLRPLHTESEILRARARNMLALTRYELLSYAPDYVVYFDAGNGLNPFNSFDIQRDESFGSWLYRRSALYRGLLRRFEWPIPAGSYTVDRDGENPSLAAYLERLDELAALVREADAKFVLLAPVVGYGPQSWSDERVPTEVYWLHDWWKPIAPEDILRHHYRVTAEGMAAFAARRSIPFLDLQDEIGDDPANFYRFGPILDLGHFSARGNREIAVAVADHIRQDLQD